MKSFIASFLLTCAWITLPAQESVAQPPRPVEKVLGLNLGYRNRQLVDEQKSALTYASGETLAGIFYRREGPASLFKIAVSASTGNFYARHFRNRWLYSTTYDIKGIQTTDSIAVRSVLTGGNLEADFLLKLYRGRRTTWLAGASVKEMMIYPENKIGMFNSLGLHANLGLIHATSDKSKLRVNFSVPLAALNSRLPWHNTASHPIDSETLTFFKEGTTLVGPDDYKMPELDVDYELHIFRRWNIGAGYSFTWLHIPAYQPLKSVLHTFQFQTSFKL